jgi:hypothetical protein
LHVEGARQLAQFAGPVSCRKKCILIVRFACAECKQRNVVNERLALPTQIANVQLYNVFPRRTAYAEGVPFRQRKRRHVDKVVCKTKCCEITIVRIRELYSKQCNRCSTSNFATHTVRLCAYQALSCTPFS